jgi:hypothetical protein
MIGLSLNDGVPNRLSWVVGNRWVDLTDREPLQREGVLDAERALVVTPKCLINQEEVREAVGET